MSKAVSDALPSLRERCAVLTIHHTKPPGEIEYCSFSIWVKMDIYTVQFVNLVQLKQTNKQKVFMIWTAIQRTQFT